MFLNYIKNLFIKKALKNRIHNVNLDVSRNPIKTIGILVDESCFLGIKALIGEIVSNGIDENNIKVIVYGDLLKKKEVHFYPTFSLNDFRYDGFTNLQSVNEFISDEFDLLINYYDVEKPLLLLLTNDSKAKFKVGFSSVDKRLNHLMITCNLADYTVFVHELFKYLKILNKI